MSVVSGTIRGREEDFSIPDRIPSVAASSNVFMRRLQWRELSSTLEHHKACRQISVGRRIDSEFLFALAYASRIFESDGTQWLCKCPVRNQSDRLWNQSSEGANLCHGTGRLDLYRLVLLRTVCVRKRYASNTQLLQL